MAAFTQYEDAASAFLQSYPVDSTVRGEEILAWATDHADGLASDLLIDDDAKKLSALRRHLNSGAASRSFAETERFYIDVTDPKRKIFVVRQLADHVANKATMAFGKSVSGAISPLKASQKALEDIKRDELDPDDRAEHERLAEDIINTLTPVKRLYNARAVDRWVLRLEAKGYTKEQARNLVELIPMFQREMKILRATS